MGEFESEGEVDNPGEKVLSRKIVILIVIGVIALIAETIFLLQVRANRQEAAAADAADGAKTACEQEMKDYQSIPNPDKAEIKLFSEGEGAAKAAAELLDQKKYKEAEEAYEKSQEVFSKAAEQLKDFNKQSDGLAKVRDGLSAFSLVESSLPKLKDSQLNSFLKECTETEELIKTMDLQKAAQSIQDLKKKIKEFKSDLLAKEKLANNDWDDAVKENSKNSFNEFISKYPHSSYASKAKEKISNLENTLALQEKKKREELARKQALRAQQKAQQNNSNEPKEATRQDEVKTIKFDDGSSYAGQVNSDKKPHGTGTWSYVNGNSYRGEWVDGLFEGKGTFTFNTGLFFEGTWKQGKRHGLGQLTWDNGDRFAGTWIDGVLNGKAVWAPKKGFRKQLKFYEGNELGFLSPESYKKQQETMEERYERDRLSKDQKRAYLFMKRYNAAMKRLQDQHPGLIFPDFPPYIAKHASFVSGRMSSREADKHEPILKQIFFERKRYAMASKNNEGNDGVKSGGLQSAEFGGYTITTSNLGVILDASGSMTSFLPKLRKEIKEKFNQSAFMEVNGCSLSPTNGMVITEANAKWGTVAAVRFLVEQKGVDTIYWFSDLNDNQDDKALDELEQFFYDNLITFYLSSVGHKPSERLQEIIDATGGKVLKNK